MKTVEKVHVNPGNMKFMFLLLKRPQLVATDRKFKAYIYIHWTVPPYTNSHQSRPQIKHKHDGPKMPLRSWVGTFCQSTNPQRSWVFHSVNPIVHKQVGFVYTLTGKGQ